MSAARETAADANPEDMLDGPWTLVPTTQCMATGRLLPTYGVKANGLWVGRAHPLGPSADDLALARKHGELFAASKGMAAVLQEALDQFGEAFEADEEVDGGDLVEFFAEWRKRVRAAMKPAGGV